jgi:hypothetical protein
MKTLSPASALGNHLAARAMGPVIYGGAVAGVAAWTPASVTTANIVQWLYETEGLWRKDKAHTGDDRILNGGPGLQEGQCLDLDGVSQYVTLGAESDALFAGDFTVKLTITEHTAAGYLFHKLQGEIGINYGANVAGKFALGNSSGVALFAVADPVGEVVVVHDTAETGFARWKLYFNGSEVSQDSTVGSYVQPGSTTTDLEIGRRSSGAPYYTGKLFDFRVYSAVLTADEITHVSTFGASGTDPGLANCEVWLKLDEQSGTTAYDSSGNGNHGTLVNGPTRSTQTLKSWQNDVGYSLSGAVFVPRDESDTDNDVLGNPLDYAGEAPRHGKWVNHHALLFAAASTQYCSLGNLAVSPKSIAFRMRASNLGVTGCIFDLNGTDYIQIISGAITEAGFSAAAISIYVDGVLSSAIGDTSYYHSVVVTSDTAFSASAAFIGALAGSSLYADMGICDIRLSTDEWSSADALTYHNEFGSVTTLSNIVKWWPLAEGDTTIYEVMATAAGKVCTNDPTVERQDVFAYNLYRGFFQSTLLFPRTPALADGTSAANNFGSALNHPAKSYGSNGAESRVDYDFYSIPALDFYTLGHTLFSAYDYTKDDLSHVNRWFMKRVVQYFDEQDTVLYDADLTGDDWDAMHLWLDTVTQINDRLLHAYPMEAWVGTGPRVLEDLVGSMDLEDHEEMSQEVVAGLNNNGLQISDTGGFEDISVAANADINLNLPITFIGWCKITGEPSNPGDEVKLIDQNGGGMSLVYREGSQDLKWTYNGTTITSQAVTVSEYNFYFISKDEAGNMCLFFNGVRAAIIQATIISGTGTLKYFEDGNAMDFVGFHDEAAIFGTARLRDNHAGFLGAGKYINVAEAEFKA